MCILCSLITANEHGHIMNARTPLALLFALTFLITIPTFVHALWMGAYKPNDLRTFWIGPISTTIPYVVLALLFLAHCFNLKSKSQRSAYCGAIMAWLSMMAFTVFLIFQTPGPKLSSTMGIAALFTPFCYIPFLVLPYIIGVNWKQTRGKSSEKGK